MVLISAAPGASARWPEPFCRTIHDALFCSMRRTDISRPACPILPATTWEHWLATFAVLAIDDDN
jgi:hypothetical protein